VPGEAFRLKRPFPRALLDWGAHAVTAHCAEEDHLPKESFT
jgi:hypothetical protein